MVFFLIKFSQIFHTYFSKSDVFLRKNNKQLFLAANVRSPVAKSRPFLTETTKQMNNIEVA